MNRLVVQTASGGCGQHRGVALVLALLVVALASALAVSMGNDYLVRMRRFANQLNVEQAHFYLLSAEQIAKHVLLENAIDYHQGNKSAHLVEPWNYKRSIAVEGGQLRFHFESYSAQLGINLIANGAGNAGRQPVPYNVYQRRFIRLLRSFDELPLSEQEALEITQAVFDWIDADTLPEGHGGMESGSYQSLGLNYRPRNKYMGDVSELQLIPRISPRLYRLLAAHVSANVPNPGIGINVNMASRNVLRSLPETNGLSPLSEEELDSIMQHQSRIFTTVPSFQNLPGWAGQINTHGISVINSDFLVRAEVRLNGHSFRLASHMYVERPKMGGRVIIISRAYSWL